MSTGSSVIKNLEAIAAIIPVPLYWFNINSVILGANEHTLKGVGASSLDEIIGKTPYDIYPKQMAEKIVKHNEEVILKEQTLAQEEIIRDLRTGEVRYYTVSKSPLRDENGKVIGVIGSSIEITAEKKAEASRLAALKKSNMFKHLTLIAPFLPAPFYWHDTEGRFLGANEHALRVLGISKIENLIGKSVYDLYPGDMADRIFKHNQEIMQTGRTLSQEESIQVGFDKVRYFSAAKAPLRDEDGNIVGTFGTSIEITAEKEAERLRQDTTELKLKNKEQLLQEKEKLIALANKVAHDISSPLSALSMAMPLCDELPESKRSLIKRATESVLDITNNLLNTYRNEQQRIVTGIEQRQPTLVSDVINHLLSEKRMQYRNHQVTLETAIASDAHFAFIRMQPIEFRRSVSNLINNAVDALEDDINGKVTIHLTVDANALMVTIQDNGKGMTAAMIEKMQNRQAFTEGKENGHGLGLQQVWDTLEYNQGLMEVQSVLGKGTTIQLTFPRIGASNWIAQDIHLLPDNIIVILDDDESIHTAWDLRFTPLLALYPSLEIHHFTQGQEALDFLAALSPKQRELVIFLSDYELLQQRKNGLEVVKEAIKDGGIKRAMLVTSYYSNSKIGEEADRLGIKILPKQMASIIPILFDNENALSDADALPLEEPIHTSSQAIPNKRPVQKTQVVLLDDDQVFADAVAFRLSGNKVVTHYPDPTVFLNEHEKYAKDTPICIDNNYGDDTAIKGLEVAERLHALEFTRLFLISGEHFAADALPAYVTFIKKPEVELLYIL